MAADTDSLTILHLEDDALDAQLVSEFLKEVGASIVLHRAETRAQFETALASMSIDLILADYQLPTFDGVSALAIARDLAPDVPFIFVSGALGEELAVEAVKRGATDFVVKQRLERLPAVVERAIRETREKQLRKQAESQLVATETKFAELADNVPILCFMADPGGRVYWVNRRWYDYSGLSGDQLLGSGWTAALTPEDLSDFRRRWNHSMATGDPFEMTFALRRSDGALRTFLTRVVPLRDDHQEIARWFGTSTDVTEQESAKKALHELNETLEQRVVSAIAEREKMLSNIMEAKRTETLGQMTGGVAHDFNNLLTPILGTLDILRRRADGDAQLRRLIDGAVQSADRAKILVQRLLAFSKKQILDPRSVDVAQLLDGMSQLISRSLGPNIKIEIDAEPDLPPARVDPRQLELAILNLAVNARDAMPDGGRLRAHVAKRNMPAENDAKLRQGTYVCVSISDDGDGMDDEVLARAVEPFYSTKEPGKGTGLGLSMVHGLAAQSGGRLALQSKVGSGTTAEIWLPEAREPADPGEPAFQLPIAGEPLNILVVDDEDLVRASTIEMLTDLGHTVIEARSGAEAIDALNGGAEPDVVITDYLMPGLNGIQLATELKQMRPNLPILIATGYAQLAGDALPDLPLIAKPFRQSELGTFLMQVVSRRD
jgi:PAS domain S-box-containing protein